jgi:hypothetical protein
VDSPSATIAGRLGNLLTRSNSHRRNPAARQRFGRETPPNKTSRYALAATGGLLVLAALAVFVASPLHAATVGLPLLAAGIGTRMASVMKRRSTEVIACSKVASSITTRCARFGGLRANRFPEAFLWRLQTPARGRLSKSRAEVQSERWFRRALRWRAGIEGRIGTLKHRFGLLRASYKGDWGFKRYVGWGIVTHNLVSVARARARRAARQDARKTNSAA